MLLFGCRCWILLSVGGVVRAASHFQSFFSKSILVYFFPVPLTFAAGFYSAKSIVKNEYGILLIVCILGISISFLATYILALIFPIIPGVSRIL
jgi:positive regulator of sigma E activity